MVKLKKILYTGLLLWSGVNLYAQDSTPYKNESKTPAPVVRDTIFLEPVKKEAPSDSLAVASFADSGSIAEEADSLALHQGEAGMHGLLSDDPKWKEIDRKWMALVRASMEEDSLISAGGELPATEAVVEELSTDLLKERLRELDSRTPFHITYNPDLERLIKDYLKNRKEVFMNLMAKAKYYFPLFEQTLDKYDIPLEVKYLAIVESALKPTARSRAGATGLWQFMFGTGRQYGLKISSYVDERQDPLLATDAACRYIEDLHDIFGDWDLALAAYNSGPGNVTKAIRRSGGYKNYWNLRMFLPRETAGYLPIFYATMYLFEFGDSHGLHPSDQFDIHYYETDTVWVKHLITFDQIEKKTGISAELLRFLNPAYKLEIIPKPHDRTYHLVLPVDYVGIFVQNEEAIYAYAAEEEAKREKPLPKYAEINQRIRYRVRKGDYLGKIARKFGVSVRSIKRWNHLRSSRIRVGQRLTIYPRRFNFSAQKTSPQKTSVKKKIKPLPKGKVITYKIKEGDSLWSIAQQFEGVSVQNLREWNGIWGNKLQVGQTIRLVQSK